MAIYRYQHGDRPLEGFTIKHGLGRGGFGEVYYAISDSGREVALKAVQNYEDIELRGIKHCMNLKNPQLVSIFDIKHSEQGLPFVVMEYIDGPSLREILDTHPEGLGAAKAAFFLKEIVKGLTYLHECGVVHRDLKPHNVFYEQGVVKIGDYSLSKVISTSHRSGHTVTVGTVHYMAPEIGLGHYDHTVDIYALGVMLYEMLTGHPPFLGDSMGEVLMKHVAGTVDVSGIEEPFASVIKKALSKEPAERYQNAQAMVDELMGNAGLQLSVASLGPESLTVIAEKAMRQAKQSAQAESEPAATAAFRSPGNASPGPRIFTAKASPKAHADPYRHTIDVRPLRRFGGPLPWVIAIVVSIYLLRAAGRLGHPGPLIPIIFFAVGFAVWRKRCQRAQFAARRARHSVVASRDAIRPVAPIPEPFAAQPVVDPGPKIPNDAYAAAEASFQEDAIDESPYSRLIALAMSCLVFFVPVAGLQRIYVGKLKSGLLWLFTFGLFGIGQVIDMVMIALGQFKDANGKRVLNFTNERLHALKQPVNQYSAVVRDRWTESRVGFKLGNLLFNFLGAILLLAALGLGALVSVDIPQGMAAGAFGIDLRRHIAEGTGVHDWNLIASAVLGIVTVVAGTLAAICLIFARRESNWGHMLRIPVSAAAFVGSILALGTTTSFGQRWQGVADLVQDHLIGGAFHYLARGNFWPGLICSCVLFVFAVFILAWPAKRKQGVHANPTHDQKHEAQVRKQTA